jgi:hypothetical protein
MTSNLDEEFFLRICIEFYSRIDSFFNSTDKLPMGILVKSTHFPIFIEEKESLSEIVDFYDEEIKCASKDLIDLSHKEVDPSICRIKIQVFFLIFPLPSQSHIQFSIIRMKRSTRSCQFRLQNAFLAIETKKTFFKFMVWREKSIFRLIPAFFYAISSSYSEYFYIIFYFFLNKS